MNKEWMTTLQLELAWHIQSRLCVQAEQMTQEPVPAFCLAHDG